MSHTATNTLVHWLQGEPVLQIWDSGNPAIADYVNIVVGYAIQPAEYRVTLGNIICYHTKLVTSSGKYQNDLLVARVFQ